jgi:hypothetical protein
MLEKSNGKRVIFLDVNKARVLQNTFAPRRGEGRRGKGLMLSLVKSVETSLDVARGS